jgi:class 3 adenylate cyclase/tetratricopeptide (TPR) repeat protein
MVATAHHRQQRAFGLPSASATAGERERVICSSCGTENRPGRKFCSACGGALALACPNCGAANEIDDRFCGECGISLGGPTSAAPSPRAVGREPAVAERRLVSVLFADLVGFTTLSESRDPEEVRELLSQYFDTARRLIGRYGGTVEKFIGDAVMAVWGAPVAKEDDAERAVRAALDLVVAVAALGDEVHAPDLALRVGVATGETAVTLGVEGEGMVAGDLVNTASRVQTVADPGTVLVTDATRRATEVSIVHEEAGAHELKGKAEPVALFRAVRVIALVGGELRAAGLESPFVGRVRDFRLLKDLFHAAAEDRKAHLLSVTGVAGIGKSRLSWEFFKYIDGLADAVWWHRGRCIAYGDGVTYWALAEMVRMRARIAEDETPDTASQKLRAAIDEHVPDEEERRFIEPRLAHLLGFQDRASASREDLFAGCRMFFERMSERAPVVMVFEDLQWADESLLDLIEYLLEWSRTHPLFVVTLARPELLERRPTWGAGRHGSTSLSLEPLADGAMDELLGGMVPGLPDELRIRIRDRAEGIPLYAIETVRMLLDRGLVKRQGDRFEPTGPVEELAVPETLQALIAARLDGLPPEERTLLQDASVLGKTFTRAGVGALTDRSEDVLDPLLASLVRKELLSLQLDARSPERGQYGFLQSLVQKVAHDTLSKRDLRARHLAAADHIEGTWSGDEDEIVEVIASHLLEAYRLAPEAEDADRVRARACDMLARAGRRAQSLAAQELARGYFERAAELTEDPERQAGLLEQSGACAFALVRIDDSIALYERARDLYSSVGNTHGAARASARIGEGLWTSDRPEEGADRMEAALAVLADAEPDHDLAILHAMLGKVRFFLGDLDRAIGEIDIALEIGEALVLPDVVSDALNTKALIRDARGGHEEALGLLKHALQIALEHDVAIAAMRAYSNLSYLFSTRDRLADARRYQEEGLALCNRFGFRGQAIFLRAHLEISRFAQGEWSGFDALVDELRASTETAFYGGGEGLVQPVISYLIARGDVAEAAEVCDRFVGDADAGDAQTRAFRLTMRAMLRNGQGRHDEALEFARSALALIDALGSTHNIMTLAFAQGLEAGVASGDLPAADELLQIAEHAPPGGIGPVFRATAARFGAAVAAMRGDRETSAAGFGIAEDLFRELQMPFDLAKILLEHAELLVATGRSGEARPMLDEAREIFERLEAAPFLERTGRLEPELAKA